MRSNYLKVNVTFFNTFYFCKNKIRDEMDLLSIQKVNY